MARLLPLNVNDTLQDFLKWPELSRGVLAVWRRNFKYFRMTILVSLFWACFEPVLYLLAVGYGLGALVPHFGNLTYAQFFFPGLLATTSMTISYFESTYGSFTKLTHQQTFSTILLSPIGSDDIVIGEILWAASKGAFSVVAVCIVALIFGLITTPAILPALLILFLNCWLFAAFGLLSCSFARNYDSFIYATSGFIVPMSLFAGTYFPLSQFPDSIHSLAYLLPLTHTVTAVRDLLTGKWEYTDWFFVAVILILALITTNWACARLKRIMIR